MKRTIGRRAFLVGTGSVVMGANATVPAVATSADEWHAVDFERLVESTFASLPDGSSDLRDGLATLAGAIHQELSPVTERAIRRAADSVSKASTLARRTQYAIEILQNNDLARYLDDAWVATFRSKIGVVTRFLPLVGGFNNLYHHAEVLDTAVENNWFISDVNGEKFESFGYSLATFALEVGLWWFGAPFKMAWKGTRFVSNRTLLRALNYLDNRLVGLVMSEIHWKIREKVYESISGDNIEAVVESAGELEYYASRFDELADAAGEYELRGRPGTYLDEVDPDIGVADLREFGFVGGKENNQNGEIDLDSWIGDVL